MKKAKKSIPEPMQYAAKKSFFSAKEIIFRSNGRAKVFTISSKMQVIFLFLVVFVGVWSFYYYHMYHRSDMIIVKKNNKVTRYKSEKGTGKGKGERVGVAYRLESGEIIYVPDSGTP